MKKQIGVLLMSLLMGSSMGVAQGDSTKAEGARAIEIQIENNTLRIESENLNDLSQLDLNRMMMEVTERLAQIDRQNQKISAQIDQMEANQEIKPEQAEVLRRKLEKRRAQSIKALELIMESWGESYAANMEDWAKQFEADMEAWAIEAREAGKAGTPLPPYPALPPPPQPIDSNRVDSNREKRVVISKSGVTVEEGTKDEDVITWQYKADEEEEQEERDDRFFDDDFFDDFPRSSSLQRTKGYFDIHFGWNVQLEEGQFLVSGPGEQDIFNSTAFALGAGAKSRIGNPYSNFYMKYGVEFSWHVFRLNGNDILIPDDDRSRYGTADSSWSLDRNKYHIAYLNIPIMFQMDFSEPGETDQSWTLGLGGYGGIRIDATRTLEYASPRFREVIERSRAQNNFHTNQLRYGVMAQVGYSHFKITVSYDLNPFFQPGQGPSDFDYNMLAFTAGLTF